MTDLFDLVESRDTETLVNLASGVQHFRQIVDESESGRRLRIALQDPDAVVQVESRIRLLAGREFDRAYENPADAALAVYLHSLYSALGLRAALAAELVRQADQCWWAFRIAEQIPKPTSHYASIGRIAPRSSQPVFLLTEAALTEFAGSDYPVQLTGLEAINRDVPAEIPEGVWLG